MSIRLRLTLLYSVILVLTLIVSDTAVYLVVSQVTLNIVKNSLTDEVNRIVSSKKFELNYIDYPGKKVYAPETYIQTLDPEGTIISRTANLGENTLPTAKAGLQTLKEGQSWTEIVLVDNGRLYVYSRPIKDHIGHKGIIQVGRSLADYDQSLVTLRNILVMGSSVVTIIAFAVGWLLAGTALRPINYITKTAQTIGNQRDFNRRVDYAGPNDEIGRLAKTINAMLEELRAAYQHVEQTLQAQRRFVADASHELRTPLTTIRGNLELLRREPPISEEDKSAVLRDGVDECDRLIRLVNDLLVLARADAGYTPQRTPVVIKPLIGELCRQMQRLAPERTFICDSIPEVMVLGNRDALKQVFLILFDNALKYTQGPITVSAKVEDSHISTCIVDTGPGIEASLLPHLFERFYRGDTARSGTDTGLGLAIAKALVEVQGGSITVESQVNRGSTFTVTLPQAPANAKVRVNDYQV